MIHSNSFSRNPNSSVTSTFDLVKKYTELCVNYGNLPPEEKIIVQISKYYVWKVEINSIERMIQSNNLTDIEKLLLEDQQNILLNEAWKCRVEIYRLYQDELPQDYPDAEKFLEKIEVAHLSMEIPIVKRNIGPEKYFKLSPTEKMRLLISQRNMLIMEKFALGRRKKSHKLQNYENQFLNYRIEFLEKCIDIISNCTIIIFYDEFKRDTPDVEKYFEEFSSAGFRINPHCVFKGKEDFRYPYDFKRPNEISLEEWGSPETY